MPMKTQQLLPEVLEMDMRKWFKEAQYGMMAHWGLYSLLGGEWNGKKSSSHAEWIQATQRIPMAEYDKLARAFNPVDPAGKGMRDEIFRHDQQAPRRLRPLPFQGRPLQRGGRHALWPRRGRRTGRGLL